MIILQQYIEKRCVRVFTNRLAWTEADVLIISVQDARVQLSVTAP